MLVLLPAQPYLELKVCVNAVNDQPLGCVVCRRSHLHRTRGKGRYKTEAHPVAAFLPSSGMLLCNQYRTRFVSFFKGMCAGKVRNAIVAARRWPCIYGYEDAGRACGHAAFVGRVLLVAYAARKLRRVSVTHGVLFCMMVVD